MEITRARLSALSFLHEFVSTLHHSRFGPEDRRLLDTTVQQQIGRDRPNGGGLIVVGTQTLEQSLDLDADLLLTGLCHRRSFAHVAVGPLLPFPVLKSIFIRAIAFVIASGS